LRRPLFVVRSGRAPIYPAGPQASFQTFQFSYTTPMDACWVRIELSASAAIDVDAVR